MHRALIEAANPLLAKQERSIKKRNHLKKILYAKKTLNTNAPVAFDIGRKKNLKKILQAEGKLYVT